MRQGRAVYFGSVDCELWLVERQSPDQAVAEGRGAEAAGGAWQFPEYQQTDNGAAAKNSSAHRCGLPRYRIRLGRAGLSLTRLKFVSMITMDAAARYRSAF